MMYNIIRKNKYPIDCYENYTPQIDSTKIFYCFGMIITGLALVYGITKNLKEITKNIKEINRYFQAE